MENKRALLIVANATGADLLPPNVQYENRMQIRSETSTRVYIVAQRISDGSWTCSCPGWKNARNGHHNRTCKHLKAMVPLLENAFRNAASIGRTIPNTRSR